MTSIFVYSRQAVLDGLCFPTAHVVLKAKRTYGRCRDLLGDACQGRIARAQVLISYSRRPQSQTLKPSVNDLNISINTLLFQANPSPQKLTAVIDLSYSRTEAT